MDWKALGMRLLGVIVGSALTGLGAKAQGGSWTSAGATAGMTAVGLLGYSTTHTVGTAATGGQQ